MGGFVISFWLQQLLVFICVCGWLKWKLIGGWLCILVFSFCLIRVSLLLVWVWSVGQVDGGGDVFVWSLGVGVVDSGWQEVVCEVSLFLVVFQGVVFVLFVLLCGGGFILNMDFLVYFGFIDLKFGSEFQVIVMCFYV